MPQFFFSFYAMGFCLCSQVESVLGGEKAAPLRLSKVMDVLSTPARGPQPSGPSLPALPAGGATPGGLRSAQSHTQGHAGACG